jgi:thiol-disulfide isomerase/thioredoxin
LALHGLAGWIGLPVVLFLGLASLVSPTKAAERSLQIAPPEAKPPFNLTLLDGSALELQQKAAGVVLVHFFATWCEPCREELSSLSRLVSGAGSNDVSVLAVNVAEVPVRVQRFLAAAPVNFPVLLDQDRAVTKAWNVSVLPTTFVLDRNLVPRLFVEGDLDWTRPDVLDALEQVRVAGQE